MLFVVPRVDVHAGDAFLVEHLEIAAVVLEPETKVETVVAELGDGCPLELACGGVVAHVAHDEKVPAHAVAVEPGEGLGLHPDGAAGEEDDVEVAVEQLEQAGDLLDQRVVAARVEERSPVAFGLILQEVLAVGGVGQDAVDVDQDCRAGERTLPPAPV